MLRRAHRFRKIRDPMTGPHGTWFWVTLESLTSHKVDLILWVALGLQVGVVKGSILKVKGAYTFKEVYRSLNVVFFGMYRCAQLLTQLSYAETPILTSKVHSCNHMISFNWCLRFFLSVNPRHVLNAFLQPDDLFHLTPSLLVWTRCVLNAAFDCNFVSPLFDQVFACSERTKLKILCLKCL